jgi:hypothetical protein
MAVVLTSRQLPKSSRQKAKLHGNLEKLTAKSEKEVLERRTAPGLHTSPTLIRGDCPVDTHA